MNKKIKMKRRKNLHGRPGDVSEKLNSQIQKVIHKTEMTLIIWVSILILTMTCHPLIKQPLIFSKKNHRNVLKFVLGFIQRFDDKITAMKNKVGETPSNPRWWILIKFLFKILITQHRDILSLRHTAKGHGIQSREGNHQFHVGYMTHPFTNKHRIHRDHIVKTFQSSFKLVTLKCIKDEYQKIMYLFFHWWCFMSI